MNRRASTLAVQAGGARRDVPRSAVRCLQRHAEKRGRPVADIVADLLDRIAREDLVDAVLDDQAACREGS